MSHKSLTLILIIAATFAIAASQSSYGSNLYNLKNNHSLPRQNLDFEYQEKFQVDTEANGIPFYGQYFTGYVKVNTTTNSSLFYTLYSAGGNNPAATDSNLNTSNPLILWIQGGPGCSGWIGNLQELGPMTVTYDSASKAASLKVNPFSWNTNNHLLFVDQPIGTGFSFGGNGETQNNTVSSSIYLENFLIRFFQIYPELVDNPFYIAGESYAGHYIPGLAARLVQNRDVNKIKVAGIAIGNGLVAPQYQLVWDSFPYAAGLIDPIQRRTILSSENQAKDLMAAKNWKKANDYMDIPQGQLASYAVDLDSSNFRRYSDGSISGLEIYLGNSSTRTALNLDPSVKYDECSGTVGDLYTADIPQDYSVNITYVLNTDPSIKVLIYNGADDTICSNNGQLAWVKNLEWVNITSFQASPKGAWKLDNGTIAGTYKTYGQFTYAHVFKAGHLVPGDQPESAWKMLNNWFANQWN